MQILEFEVQKKRNCKKGYPCGRSCINRARNCRNTLEGQAKTFTGWLKLQGNKTVKGSSSSLSAQKKVSKTPKNFDKLREESLKSNNRPSFKAQKFNPYAIENLSFDEFQSKYLRYKEAVFKRERKLATAQTQLDDDLKKSYVGAKLAVTRAIEQGLYVPDTVIGKTKLKKSLREKNQANKQPDPEIERLRKQAEPIIKAVEYPLVSEAEGKGHKPTLSREEADAYTQGSYAAGLSFYHGNPTPVVRSIANDGADPSLNEDGYYGKGTYFATSRAVAEGYMSRGIVANSDGSYTFNKESSGKSGNTQKQSDPEMGLIEVKTKIKNPFVATAADLDNNVPGGGRYLHDFTRAKGYDSIYVKDFGYFIAFDTKQVTVVDKQEYKVGDPETDRIARQRIDSLRKGRKLETKQGKKIRGSQAFADRVTRFSATHKYMNNASSSKF